MEIFKYMEASIILMLDLLQLSSLKEDISPNSWIWISGKGFRRKLSQILKEIIEERNINKLDLIKEINNNLDCSIGPLNRFVWGKEDNIPLPLLNKLLEYYSSKI